MGLVSIFSTQNAYAAATGRNKESRSRLFRKLLNVETSAKMPRLNPVPAVLPTLHRAEHHAISALLDFASKTGAFFVGHNVLPFCQKFAKWADEGMKGRLHSVQRRRTTALAAGLQSSVVFDPILNLHAKFCLVPGVLRFVILNDPSRMPDFFHRQRVRSAVE